MPRTGKGYTSLPCLPAATMFPRRSRLPVGWRRSSGGPASWFGPLGVTWWDGRRDSTSRCAVSKFELHTYPDNGGWGSARKVNAPTAAALRIYGTILRWATVEYERQLNATAPHSCYNNHAGRSVEKLFVGSSNVATSSMLHTINLPLRYSSLTFARDVAALKYRVFSPASLHAAWKKRVWFVLGKAKSRHHRPGPTQQPPPPSALPPVLKVRPSDPPWTP